MKYSRLEGSHDLDNGEEGPLGDTATQPHTGSKSWFSCKQVCLLLSIVCPWLITTYLLVQRERGTCRAMETPQSISSGGFPQVLFCKWLFLQLP